MAREAEIERDGGEIARRVEYLVQSRGHAHPQVIAVQRHTSERAEGAGEPEWRAVHPRGKRTQ